MFEVQLGHLCNDRCVFCISGRLTSEGKAPLLAVETLERRIRKARADGHRAITFLGGEPTIQPFFLDLVRVAVELGFDPIVIFTNGGKAGRTKGELVDQVIATGGSFEWRMSFHGATREAHERTTRRRGSFDQLLVAAQRVAERGQRLTVNTCVVEQNYRSLDAFPALLAPFGVAQLHVDMIHPEDTGNLSLDALREIMVRYTDLAPVLRRMVAGFDEGFDVNIGNVPYCIAPDLAPFIHHGGRPTETAPAHDFGLPVLQPVRAKYDFKERHNVKAASCAPCELNDRCAGLFPEYAAIYGTEELRPISAAMLDEVDRDGRLFALRAAPVVERALAGLGDGPFDRVTVHGRGPRVLSIDAVGPDGGRLSLTVAPPDLARAHAAFDRAAIRVTAHEGPLEPALAWLRALSASLAAAGWQTRHPISADALAPISPKVAGALRRWRDAAPFGELAWTEVAIEEGGARAVVTLEAEDGASATAWIDARGTGYRWQGAEGETSAPPPLVDGLRHFWAALRSAR